MKTDMSLLGTDQLENNSLQNSDFHLVFNSREYQKLDHGEKMEMMWN